MYRNAIFDWSGTLNNNTPGFFYAINHICAAKGRPPIPIDEIRREFDVPYMEFWARYIPELTKAEQDRLFVEAMSKAPKPDIHPGVKDSLTRLKNHQVKLFLVSSDHAPTLIPEAERFGVKGLFDGIYTSVHDKGKGLLQVIADHGLDPAQTLYVGDLTGDIYAAKEARVLGVGITWGIHTEEKLRTAGAGKIIHSISELEQTVDFVPLS